MWSRALRENRSARDSIKLAVVDTVSIDWLGAVEMAHEQKKMDAGEMAARRAATREHIMAASRNYITQPRLSKYCTPPTSLLLKCGNHLSIFPVAL